MRAIERADGGHGCHCSSSSSSSGDGGDDDDDSLLLLDPLMM